MKADRHRPALRRIQEIIERETGRPPSQETCAELESILRQIPSGHLGEEHKREFHHREVTIVLADLRGFTSIAAGHPAGVVIQLLNLCLSRMSEIIVAHQGTIDKFMGDSIMVLFGAPTSREGDVERAVTCAVQMQLAMKALNEKHKADGLPELFMGIGINTGKVMAGLLGSEAYSEYTVIGDEVNLASRIEAFSLRGQVLISESTYERVKGFAHTGQPMAINVKGKQHPVNLREVLSIPQLDLVVPRQEVRRSHRVNANLPVTYQLIESKIVLPRVYQGTVRDIGYHGVMLQTDAELPKGTEMKLEARLPLVDYHAKDVYATVVNYKPRDGMHLHGLGFSSVAPETTMKLQLFVQLLLFTEGSA
jgi:adenylate cyclase